MEGYRTDNTCCGRGCRTIANDRCHVCRHPSNLANGDVKSSDLKCLGIISHNGLARAGRIPEAGDLEMGDWVTLSTNHELAKVHSSRQYLSYQLSWSFSSLIAMSVHLRRWNWNRLPFPKEHRIHHLLTNMTIWKSLFHSMSVPALHMYSHTITSNLLASFTRFYVKGMLAQDSSLFQYVVFEPT